LKTRYSLTRVIALALLLLIPAGMLLVSCKKKEQKAPPAAAQKMWKLAIVKYEDLAQTQQAEQGIKTGLRDAGLKEGIDFEISSRNAQGDMPAVLSLLDAAVGDKSDMLITLQTPTLHAAVQRGGNLPVVFMVVANPFVISSIGKSDSSHLPNVTGIYTLDKFDRLLSAIKECLPKAKKIGTLYALSELNAQFYKTSLEESALKAGLKLVSVGVTTRLEVPQAADALCMKGIDAICQIEDNLTSATFASIVESARKFRKPVFSLVDQQADMGSVIVTAPDYKDAAAETAFMIAKIIRGESPAAIPFQRIKKFPMVVNLKAAKEFGVVVPDHIVSQADRKIE
jgi:ABC-type uncharacterized transport system substrate-binding protein